MQKLKIGDIVVAKSKAGDGALSPRFVRGLTESVVILHSDRDARIESCGSYPYTAWDFEKVQTEQPAEKVTPENIIVGKLYKHSNFPNCFWLGCGKRQPFTIDEYSEKYLVLVASPPETGGVGLIFKTEDDRDGCWPGDWDKFELVD